MRKKNDGGPAFPVFAERDDCDYRLPGMFLRDYFAAAAMHEIIASDNYSHAEGASEAYRIADSMLAARAESGVAS